MVTDPIADMLSSLRNATERRKESIVLPYSKFKHAVASLLEKEGYITEVALKKKKTKRFLEIRLVYSGEHGRVGKIRGGRRISKPSRRVYFGMRDIRPVRHGWGTLVLSTPKGVLSGKDAKKAHVGGEILFEIW